MVLLKKREANFTHLRYLRVNDKEDLILWQDITGFNVDHADHFFSPETSTSINAEGENQEHTPLY